MDEIGITTSLRINNLVIGANKKRKVYIRGARDRKWIFIIHTVFASGHSTIPVIIFKGISFQTQWFLNGFPD